MSACHNYRIQERELIRLTDALSPYNRIKVAPVVFHGDVNKAMAVLRALVHNKLTIVKENEK